MQGVAPSRVDRGVLSQADAGPADALLVVLPGAYDGPQDFVRHGFVRAVRERRLPLDLYLPDAHTDYYTAQKIRPYLLHEVIRPARARGYRSIWLGGISLGGYGSLLFAKQHGQLLDGVFVLAPFLGRRDLPAAIGSCGGLQHWDGQLAGADAEDLALWRWLRARSQTSRAAPMPLWLGYGEHDRFAPGHRLLAAALPPARVACLPGGHDWTTWQRLWERFLDAGLWLRPD